MLTSVTSSAVPTVSRIAAAVCSLVTAAQNSAQPPSRRGDDDGGERDEHEQAEPQHRDAEAEAGRAGQTPAVPGRPARAAPAGPGRRGDADGHSAFPDSAMIFVMMPFFSSKNFFDRADQLSKSSATVSSFFGVGERVVRVERALDAGGVDAVDDRAEALERELPLAGLAQHEVEPLGFAFGLASLSTAPGFSMRMVVSGRTQSSSSPFWRGQDRLVLVGEQDVAGAAEEARGGVAAAAGQRDDVGEELGQEVGGLRRRCRRWRRCGPTRPARSTGPRPTRPGWA